MSKSGTICPVCSKISFPVDIGKVSCNECVRQFFTTEEYDKFRIGKEVEENWIYVCQDCCNKAEEVHYKDFHISIEVV